ncbi:RE1-silencing transcription factor [Pristis pectinata]|uniref:RE1-silencing transcription factor n=1 Tax=Pristis pectinata TaxID=685728 RepID=UPI00223CFD40|nr:RE1-silencing transcription factor [Pristis pectinata]
MAAQVLEQSSGTGMFSHSNIGISSNEEICGLNYLSKNDLTAAPQLVMLANVALTGDISCYDYHGEDRLMAELKTVDGNLSDNEEELRTDINDTLQSENVNAENQSVSNVATKGGSETSSQDVSTDSAEVVNQENLADKGKKSKPFRCRPCDYEAESEMEFVHHIKVHSAKKFIVEENAEKQSKSKVPDPLPEEADISKGPIRCDRCGYNTNRYDHYLAHLKHHDKVGENEKVYKCTICTYTTVSEYHWKKHLRNHFPRKVYTCSQCSYFSDRKNNYVQHMRTHTGERPYKCPQCPYSSSQKTHLTRHMRTHSGEKPFKCDQCNYVASNQHEVTRHARQVHNGPKPLTCPHCEYRTADRSNFKKHVELHVNPRQFLCPVCKYAASKKCNLQYHIKSKHPHCSDITMDVSKVKLRTKRLELDAPLAKVGKKMSDKLQLKRVETLDKKATAKAEKTTAVSKEHSLSTISSKVKTRNHKVFSHKHLPRKRDTDTEKARKIKSTKRKRCLTAEGSLQQEPVDETPVEAKRKKIGKAKELIELEAKRSKIKLDKTSHRKNLKCKRVKKKNKKYRKAAEHSTGDSPDKYKKSDQPEQQSIVPKKKKDCSRNSSCSNLTIEGTHKIESQNSEPFWDKTMNKTPLGTVIEQNENALNVHSTENASRIVQKITKESQTSFDQLTPPESEEPMLAETLAVEETAIASTEHAGAFICSSGQAEGAAHSSKTCSDVSNSETKEMSAETDFISDQERCVQVISIELAFELSNSNNSNNDQDGIAYQDEGHNGMDDQMKVEDDTNKQIDVQDGQSRLQDDVSKVPGALDDQKKDQDCVHKIQNGQSNQDQLQDDGDEVEKNKQEQNKKQNKDEVMEIDEDEGIHSHEGSETSEDSEGSDDSGLNGAKPTTDDKINKRTPEDVNDVPGNFVCIFCDRIFGVKGEFTKHLNRHLVNVYYLEEAAKSQE